MNAFAFGSLLRRYRLSAGLSQEALAERAGLSPDAIGMLERGVRRKPYEHTIDSLAAALNLSESDREKLASAVRRRGISQAKRSFSARSPVPVPLTPLIGRERDVATIQPWFAAGGPRLVTITGAGGVGKTRFALELAHALRRQFDDDVAFVSLASVSDPTHIASAIFASLDRDNATPASFTTLGAYVADRRVLLVLDNFEQLLPGGAVLCEFLERCPRAIALVTSREAMHVRGEHEFSLEPLELGPAVELLMQRGRALDPHLGLSRNDESLVEICRRLDCLPLAIELAAARLRRESVRTLLDRVSAPLSALVFGERDAPPRQRTMRAAIDWSYHLLSDQERALFCICSLFVGGGSIEAIGAVARSAASPTGNLSDVVASLADKHLLRLYADATGETRLEMLEVIREYARERLESLPDSQAYQRAFAQYYAELMNREQNRMARSPEWMEFTAREYANVCAALRWSVEHDRSLGLRLAITLPEFWERKGLYAESRKWLEALIDPLEETIEREDPVVAWRAMNAFGLACYWSSDAPRACTLHQRALAMTRDWNDPSTTAKSLNNLGIALLDANRPERARRVLEESLSLKEGREDPWSIGSTVGNLGIALRMCGDYRKAIRCHRRAHELFRSIGDSWGEIGELNFIGDVYCDRRDYRDAASCYARSLEGNTEGIRPAIAHSFHGLVTIAVSRLEFRRAATLAGAIDRIWSETGRSESPSAAVRLAGTCAAARASLGDSSFEEAWNEGAEMSLRDAVEVGRAIGAYFSENGRTILYKTPHPRVPPGPPSEQ